MHWIISCRFRYHYACDASMFFIYNCSFKFKLSLPREILFKKVGLLSNSFQEVYANQKFQKGVIERHLNSQVNVQNENPEKDLLKIIENQNKKEHVVVDLNKDARQTNEK